MAEPEVTALSTPQARDGAATRAILMPWQQPGLWYQAMAQFVGLTERDFFYLESGEDAPGQWELALYSDVHGKNTKSLSNYYSCALGPRPPANAAHWRQCFQRLSAYLPKCRQLQLEPLNASELALLRAARLPGWGLIALPISQNWQASTTNYWSKRSSQLRHTIARKKKKLDQLGALINISTVISESLQQHYWQVYQRSWKPAEPTADFINQLLQQASSQGTLRLGVLCIAEQPIAVQCWLVADGVAAIYKLAQDKQFDSLSPGTVLTAALADYVMTQDKVHTLDFLTGDDAYKAQWMDSCSTLYRVTVFRLNNLKALAQYAVQCLKICLQQLRTKVKPKTKELL
jgi:hypothetical protein